MDALGKWMLILIGIEFVVSVLFGHVLNADIYKEEKDIGQVMKRLSAERPISARIVKACYVLILVEFLIVVFHKATGG